VTVSVVLVSPFGPTTLEVCLVFSVVVVVPSGLVTVSLLITVVEDSLLFSVTTVTCLVPSGLTTVVSFLVIVVLPLSDGVTVVVVVCLVPSGLVISEVMILSPFSVVLLMTSLVSRTVLVVPSGLVVVISLMTVLPVPFSFGVTVSWVTTLEPSLLMTVVVVVFSPFGP